MFAKRKFMKIFDAIRKYAYTALIFCGCLFALMISGSLLYETYGNYKDIKQKLKTLECEIELLYNECAHMCKEMDTLKTYMHKDNSIEIDNIKECYNLLNKRVKKVEDDLNYLYYYD